MEEKKCSRCKVLKFYSCFNRDLRHPTGRRVECRECRKKDYLKPEEQVKKWNETRKNRMKEMGSNFKGKPRKEGFGLKVSLGKKKKFLESGHDYNKSCYNRIYQRYCRLGFCESIEIFLSIINKNCFYCGQKPYSKGYNSGKTHFVMYNGIDRIKNEHGYSIENCVTCCVICNRAKHTMDYKDFKKWINRLSKK